MSPFIPPGWSAGDVERELIDAPARAYVPFEGLEIVERPGWAQLTCALFPDGGFNGVERSRLREDEADQVITQTIAGYARRGLQFRWSVPPGSTPANLGARLAAAGLVATEVLAMARSTAHDLAVPAGVTVEEIGPSRAEDFTRVMAEGWAAPLGALRHCHHAALADPLRRQRLFLALVEGEPAGVATAFVFTRSVYLLGAVVLPRFRQRGAYRALSAARLSLARDLGLPLATSHAMASTSAPLLARQGFDAWFRFSSFGPAPRVKM